MSGNLKVIYMAGGAEYTIWPLKSVIKSKHTLLHVYTKYPRPAGRGKKIIPNALQNFLDENKLSYSMPINLKSNVEIEKIKKMKPDLILVFSYGHILPKILLNIPKYGCLNIHASLLPKWRGSSPVQYSLLNNEKETGFSIMVMNEKVDEGKVLYRESIVIRESDNTYTLLEKITNLACKSIIKIINKYVEGSIIACEQDHKEASYTYTIKKNDTYLDFKDDAEIVLAKVRAYNPNPGAKCFINGELVKIIETKKENLHDNFKPGVIIDERLLISCGRNAIRPSIIQRSGKKKLKLYEALNGWKVQPGTLVKNKIE